MMHTTTTTVADYLFPRPVNAARRDTSGNNTRNSAVKREPAEASSKMSIAFLAGAAECAAPLPQQYRQQAEDPRRMASALVANSTGEDNMHLVGDAPRILPSFSFSWDERCEESSPGGFFVRQERNENESGNIAENEEREEEEEEEEDAIDLIIDPLTLRKYKMDTLRRYLRQHRIEVRSRNKVDLIAAILDYHQQQPLPPVEPKIKEEKDEGMLVDDGGNDSSFSCPVSPLVGYSHNMHLLAPSDNNNAHSAASHDYKESSMNMVVDQQAEEGKESRGGNSRKRSHAATQQQQQPQQQQDEDLSESRYNKRPRRARTTTTPTTTTTTTTTTTKPKRKKKSSGGVGGSVAGQNLNSKKKEGIPMILNEKGELVYDRHAHLRNRENGSCHRCKNKKKLNVVCPFAKSHMFCRACVERHCQYDFDEMRANTKKFWGNGCPVCTGNCDCAYCKRMKKNGVSLSPVAVVVVPTDEAAKLLANKNANRKNPRRNNNSGSIQKLSEEDAAQIFLRTLKRNTPGGVVPLANEEEAEEMEGRDQEDYLVSNIDNDDVIIKSSPAARRGRSRRRDECALLSLGYNDYNTDSSYHHHGANVVRVSPAVIRKDDHYELLQEEADVEAFVGLTGASQVLNHRHRTPTPPPPEDD